MFTSRQLDDSRTPRKGLLIVVGLALLMCMGLAPGGVAARPAGPRYASALPDTTSGIHRAIIFARCYKEFGAWIGSSTGCVQSSTTSLSNLDGKIDTGWIYNNAPITNFADPNLAGKLGIGLEFDRFPGYPYDYNYFNSTQYLAGNHAQGLNWMLANHPDWIEYKCDKATIPWEYGDVPSDGNVAAYIPFDIANPAARAYYFNTYVKPAIDHGAPQVMFDNAIVYNSFGRCGHYSSGQWVQEWSGDFQDPNFMQSVYDWQQYLYSAIKADNPNVVVTYNYDPAASNDPSTTYNQFLKGMDLLLNESGFTYWGNFRIVDQAWQSEVQVIQATQAAGVGTFHENTIPVTSPSYVTLDDKNWGIGNYLLTKGPHDYLALNIYASNFNDYGYYIDYPEFYIPIGSPTNTMYQSQSVYWRNFSGGMVVVNPNGLTAYNVNLGGTFKDMDGNLVGPALYMPPGTASVLLNPTTANQAPAFTSPNSTTFTAGTAGSLTVTASGFPAPTLSESNTDALPSGVTFNAATGTLSGTPAAGSGGSYTLHFTASNGVSPNALQTFTLTVSSPTPAAPAFTSGGSTTFTVGSPGSFAVTASGLPAPTLSESNTDTLPSGVTFNAATGVLSGTPASGTAATYTLHFTASNGVSPNASQTFTLTVGNAAAAPPGDGSGKLTVYPGTGTFNVGDTVVAYVVVTANSPFKSAAGAVTVSSNLSVQSVTGAPANFGPCNFQNTTLAPSAANPSFAESYNAGTSAGSCTLYTLTMKALSGGAGTVTISNGTILNASTGANDYGSSSNASFTINGAASQQAPAFTSGGSTTFVAGSPGSFAVTASGLPAPTLSESNTDTLPSGVTFNAATGTLSGTPAAGSGGSYTLHFTASNGVSPNASQTFTLTVAGSAPAFTSAGTATFTVGSPGSFTVTASGVPAPTLSESNTDTLPSGVTFNAATGVLSGTPAVGSDGSYTLHFTASNGTSPNASQTFTLTVGKAAAAPPGDGSGKLTVYPGTGTFNVGDTVVAYVVVTANSPFKSAAGAVTVSSNLSVQSVTAAPANFGPCNFQNTTLAPSAANPSFAESYNAGTSAGSCTLYTLTMKALSGGAGTVTISNGSILNASTGANDYGSSSNASFTINGAASQQAPAFTSGGSTTFVAGAPGSFAVTASGLPAPTLSESNTDTLPSGVTFNAATGTLSGTPAAGSGGSYTLHFTASNGVSPNASQTFTLTVSAPTPVAPAFTSAGSTTFTVGSPGSFTVTASGVPAPSLSESNTDTLPSGVTFNAATGVLNGTPASGTAATYTLHFTASNGTSPNASQTFTLTVGKAPAVPPASNNPTGTLQLYPYSGSYHPGDTISLGLYAYGNGQNFTGIGATVTVSSNLSVVGVSTASCGMTYSTTPSTANPSFAGTVPSATGNCVVYYITLRAIGTGTGRVALTGASMTGTDGTNILKATGDGVFTIN